MLGDDPWYGTILETAIVIPWDIWLDGRGGAAAVRLSATAP